MGSWIGSIKRYVSDVQNQVSNITEETIEKKLDETNSENINQSKKDE